MREGAWLATRSLSCARFLNSMKKRRPVVFTIIRTGPPARPRCLSNALRAGLVRNNEHKSTANLLNGAHAFPSQRVNAAEVGFLVDMGRHYLADEDDVVAGGQLRNDFAFEVRDGVGQEHAIDSVGGLGRRAASCKLVFVTTGVGSVIDHVSFHSIRRQAQHERAGMSQGSSKAWDVAKKMVGLKRTRASLII